MNPAHLTSSASDIPFQNLLLIALVVVALALINNSSKLVGAFIKLKKGVPNRKEDKAPSEVAGKERPRVNRLNLMLSVASFILCGYTLFIAVPWRPNPESLGDLLLFRAFAISLSTSAMAVMIAWFMNRR